jgi:hypothetical protein
MAPNYQNNPPREAVVRGCVNGISTPDKNHLKLAVAFEGGGDGADCIKTP